VVGADLLLDTLRNMPAAWSKAVPQVMFDR
jgi:hypothetical protein